MSTIYTPTFVKEVLLDGTRDRLLDNTAPTYLYVSDYPTPPQEAKETVRSELESIEAIVLAKKLKSDNIYYLIQRNNWTDGTVYSKYSDNEVLDKNFFVISSNRAVYKCLDNNNGSPSTSEPSFLDQTSTRLPDGYTWKYMFRLTQKQLNDIATRQYIPVVKDPDTTANTVAGTIDFISVVQTGANYQTHTGYIGGKVSNNMFMLSTSASPVEGMYNGSSLYIMSGDGVGSISEITQYFSNTTGRFVFTKTSLPDVNINSQYYISPTVVIDGNGKDAKAMAILNTEGGVNHIEIIDHGTRYTYAQATLKANTIHGSGSLLKPEVSPIRGHGSCPVSELKSDALIISMTLEGDELDTVPATTKFSRMGLIKNVTGINGNSGSLIDDDTFTTTFTIDTIQVNGTLERGDIVHGIVSPNKRGLIISVNGDKMVGIYLSAEHFDNLEGIISQNGIIANIQSIRQPTGSVNASKLMSMIDVEEVSRSGATKENVNVIMKFV